MHHISFPLFPSLSQRPQPSVTPFFYFPSPSWHLMAICRLSGSVTVMQIKLDWTFQHATVSDCSFPCRGIDFTMPSAENPQLKLSWKYLENDQQIILPDLTRQARQHSKQLLEVLPKTRGSRNSGIWPARGAAWSISAIAYSPNLHAPAIMSGGYSSKISKTWPRSAH